MVVNNFIEIFDNASDVILASLNYNLLIKLKNVVSFEILKIRSAISNFVIAYTTSISVHLEFDLSSLIKIIIINTKKSAFPIIFFSDINVSCVSFISFNDGCFGLNTISRDFPVCHLLQAKCEFFFHLSLQAFAFAATATWESTAQDGHQHRPLVLAYSTMVFVPAKHDRV